MRKKISTTIYVTPEQADKLKLLHERTKVPVAVYIREGIDLVLRHYTHLLPGQLALVNADQVNASEARESRESPRPPDVANSPAAQVPVNTDVRDTRDTRDTPSSAAVGQK